MSRLSKTNQQFFYFLRFLIREIHKMPEGHWIVAFLQLNMYICKILQATKRTFFETLRRACISKYYEIFPEH